MSSLSSSDGIEDQITNALSCAMEEAIVMLTVEAKGSSSTPRLKHC
jgi:hypothetical protein